MKPPMIDHRANALSKARDYGVRHLAKQAIAFKRNGGGEMEDALEEEAPAALAEESVEIDPDPSASAPLPGVEGAVDELVEEDEEGPHPEGCRCDECKAMRAQRM